MDIADAEVFLLGDLLLVNEVWDDLLESRPAETEYGACVAAWMSTFGDGASQSWSLQRSCRRMPPRSFDSYDVVSTRALSPVSFC